MTARGSITARAIPRLWRFAVSDKSFSFGLVTLAAVVLVAMLVLTKVDLHRGWRTIMDDDRTIIREQAPRFANCKLAWRCSRIIPTRKTAWACCCSTAAKPSKL